jgi:hypothetical protein
LKNPAAVSELFYFFGKKISVNHAIAFLAQLGLKL